MRFLILCTVVMSMLGCDFNSYSGRFPKSGTHPGKVNYKVRKLVGATVFPVPEIDLENAPDDPPILQFPSDLKQGQAVAFEGQLRAPTSIVDVFVRVEFHFLKSNSPEPILSQSAVAVAENEKGIIKYRLETFLPKNSGRHRVRIGAVIEAEDDEMIGIAHGEVHVK